MLLLLQPRSRLREDWTFTLVLSSACWGLPTLFHVIFRTLVVDERRIIDRFSEKEVCRLYQLGSSSAQYFRKFLWGATERSMLHEVRHLAFDPPCFVPRELERNYVHAVVETLAFEGVIFGRVSQKHVRGHVGVHEAVARLARLQDRRHRVEDF